MIDYREPANRREAFVLWFAWGLSFNDCDPAVWMTNYLHQRYEHNIEQRLWFAWLYGNTYHLPTAWILMNEFPDFELATLDRLEQWNSANYKRLRYQTDTKWNKGHLPAMFASYQRFIGPGNQQSAFRRYAQYDGATTFAALWEAVNRELYKFGRYSTWFYLQHLKHTVGLNLEPASLMLNDYAGSRSHRNGLLLALGRDGDVDAKQSAAEYARLEDEARDILIETRARFPSLSQQADLFHMETALCSFKKIFRAHHGRYLGFYLDRQAEEIMQCQQDDWAGIHWDVLWQARQETLDGRLAASRSVRKDWFEYFINTGNIMRVEWL